MYELIISKVTVNRLSSALLEINVAFDYDKLEYIYKLFEM